MADLTEQRCGFFAERDGIRAALFAQGVTVDAEGFGYARSRNRKIDCNAVYRLLDEGLWWPLLTAKRLAIVSGHAEAFASQLMDAKFVRAAGGAEVSWSMVTALSCPRSSESKRSQWPTLRDKLSLPNWDLLLCSAGSLSAVVCEYARQTGRKSIDIGSVDAAILASTARAGTSTYQPDSQLSRNQSRT